MSTYPHERTVLQKLLWPGQTARFLREGAQLIGGPVVSASDVATLREPIEMLRTYGLTELWPYGADPDFVDVLRFPATPLMRLAAPEPGPERPWPTYPTGFLPTDRVVPVWNLATTRVPAAAEVWRLRTNAQAPVLVFAGPAVGWRNGQAWSPPPAFAGPRVEWQDAEYVAAFGADDTEWMEVVSFGSVPAGFEEVRPQVSHRMVPTADCNRVFEVELTATVRGVSCRVLDHRAGEALVQLSSADPDDADRVGATASEPGLYQALIPVEEIQNGSGSTFELDVASLRG